MDRIVVAFANEESQRRIARLLESDGVSPAGCFFSGADAIRAIRQLGGGIVVCGFKLRDMTAQDLAASLQDLATLLVVSSAANLDFCEGENLFKLATPETNCQGLFNQIHKKSTKKVPEALYGS